MKRYIILIVLIILILAIAWILMGNKKTLEKEELLSESEVEVLPVMVDEIERTELHEKFTFSGILKPEKELMVISQTQGEVLEVHFDLGDYVKKGSLIVQVDNEMLAAQYKVAEANYEKAKKDIDRFEKMAEIDGVTQDQLEKMELNLKNSEAQYITVKKRLGDTSIEAPFSGYINQMFTKKGSMLGPGVPVFEIVDIDRFKMTIKCSEDEIIHIDKGMDVVIRPKSLDNVELQGRVSKVSVSADMAQQYTIEISIGQGSGQKLKGGMVAVAEILGSENYDVIAVNKNHIIHKNGSKYVYRVVNQIVVQTEVETGISINDNIEITRGLNVGDQIITSGLNLLSDGSKVKIVE
ncbi:MAG: efflux RND transporter periplasmic adaptor subunit [Cyclobacteriaceae bacterium]|jgi:RND family efflux transporter MFP subunit